MILQMLLGGGSKNYLPTSYVASTLSGQFVEGDLAVATIGAGNSTQTNITVPTYTSGYIFVIFNSVIAYYAITPATVPVGDTVGITVETDATPVVLSNWQAGNRYLNIYNGSIQNGTGGTYTTTLPPGASLSGQWSGVVFNR